MVGGMRPDSVLYARQEPRISATFSEYDGELSICPPDCSSLLLADSYNQDRCLWHPAFIVRDPETLDRRVSPLCKFSFKLKLAYGVHVVRQRDGTGIPCRNECPGTSTFTLKDCLQRPAMLSHPDVNPRIQPDHLIGGASKVIEK